MSAFESLSRLPRPMYKTAQRGGGGANRHLIHVFAAGKFNEIGSRFLGAYNQIGLSDRLPARGTTGAVRKSRFIGRQ